MMELDRRGLLLGTVFTAAASATSLSACSPSQPLTDSLPSKFFVLAALVRLVEAKALLGPDVHLSFLTSAGPQFFQGRDDVVEVVYRLLALEGFRMIGDTDDVTVGGLYWEPMGPWLCSDMVKGNAPQFSMNDCGTDRLRESVLNVFVGIQEQSLLQTILLLENRSLSGQLINNIPLPPEF